MKEQLQHTQQEPHKIYTSRSWQITKPLRSIMYLLRSLKTKIRYRLHWKPIIKHFLKRMIAFVLKKQQLKKLAHYLINKNPNLKQRLIIFHRMNNKFNQSDFSSITKDNSTLESLTPRAQKIYHELKSAIKANQSRDNKHENLD